MRKRSLLQGLLVSVVAYLVFGVAAGAAQAEATWVVEGKVLKEGERYSVKKCALKSGTTTTLTGTLLGQEFLLTASTVGCNSWELYNEAHHAYSTGRFVLSSLSVDKPSGCSVASTIETKILKGEAREVEGLESKLAVNYKPAEGEVLATIKVSGCSLAGTYNLKGDFGAEVEPLNVFKEEQPYKFSPSINTTLGDALTLGSNAATLSGVVIFYFPS